MRAYKREAVQVIANVLVGDLPALHRMAVLAACAKLTTVNIRMTVSAARTDLFEDQARMTFCALDFLMHAAQGVPGLVVVEFRI